jgi:hypothetical protein
MKKVKKLTPPRKYIRDDEVIMTLSNHKNSLDGVRIACYIRKYDERLANLLMGYLDGKEFESYGDRAYFYRKIRSFFCDQQSFGSIRFRLTDIFRYE